MKKRQAIADQLASLMGDPNAAEAYVLASSGLPGRRANLELAEVFADQILAVATSWRQRLQSWAALGPERAPTNDPREFLPFVAAQALGALHASSTIAEQREIEATLLSAARDPRWRMREAAAFGLQRIGAASSARLIDLLRTWESHDDPAVYRAVLVALAHPPQLELPEVVAYALEVADRLFERAAGLSKKQWADPKEVVLRKGLSFAPSVFVAASPEEGFRLLGRWAEEEDVEIKKIVASNLRKARLAKHFPEQVQEVGERLMFGME